MKLIFLDVDGVLNCISTREKCGPYIGIDSNKVLLLKKIVDATEAKIVLSSTWRLGYNKDGYNLDDCIEYLESKLKECELTIFDITLNLKHK